MILHRDIMIKPLVITRIQERGLHVVLNNIVIVMPGGSINLVCDSKN